jgi:hypothetical protein
MDQKICLFLFIFFILFGMVESAFASAGKKPWSSTFSIGYTSQDFKGDETAEFNTIQHYLVDLKFQWYRRWYTIGFAYSTIPSINISSFKLTTGDVGHYKLSFNQIFLIFGATYKLMYLDLLIGSENTQWVGSPNMNLKNKPHSVMGLEIGYDAYKSKKLNFPIWFRFLNKPQRNMEFQNYTNDTILVNSGVELVLAGGAKFDF